MKSLQLIFWSIVIITLMEGCRSSNISSRSDNMMSYIAQREPVDTPEIFAPNIISLPDRYEFGSVFSKDNTELFFGIDDNGKSEIHHTQLINGAWSTSKAILKDSIFGYNDPMLTPDGNRLFFITDQSFDRSKTKKDIDIWFIERTIDGWSTPTNAGEMINSSKNEYYISFTNTGKMYFSSNVNADEGKDYDFDIYSSIFTNGKFESPLLLDKAINSNRYEADVFIAPDESYIIFCAIRENGFGNGDLYISFKDSLENWKPSQNMGPVINTNGHELCPFVTSDGKYLFYTRNQDIYWVSTKIISKLKITIP